MGTELRPLGVNCNIGCLYCYQNPQRDAGNLTRSYDMDAMKQAVAANLSPFTLFGGEALLVPVSDLEDLWAWGLEKFGKNSIQTNGILISDEHVELFRKYRVHVGISVDGPGELNDVRWHSSLKKTRESTAKTHAAIERLCRELPDSPPSLIVTLHRRNALAEHLPAMSDWFCRLDQLGVRSARLHVMEVDHADLQQRFALTSDENVEALTTFWKLEDETLQSLRFDVISDMKALLQGRDDRVSCIWRGCDSYNTQAVRGVEGNGQSSNCGRTNKDGVDFPNAESIRYDRYVNLYHTPQKHGGCSGCRFFLMCKGHCPGTAIEGDWRNRTEHCDVWFKLFERLEDQLLKEGETPLSLDERRTRVEELLITDWIDGENPSLRELLQRIESPETTEPELTDSGKAGTAPDVLPETSHTDLTPFVRCAWVSDHARKLWSPRLRRIQNAIIETGNRLAIETDRPVLMRMPAWQFLRLKGSLPKSGLQIEILPDATTSFSTNRNGAAVRGKVEYLAVIGGGDVVAQIKQAWTTDALGEALELIDMPECCRDFYSNALRTGLLDMTVAYAQHADLPHSLKPITNFNGPSVNNIFWRRLGITALFHWPCRSNCTASERIGIEFLEFSRKNGYSDETGWLEEVLSWPVEWTARHGIAELKSPILKSSMSTSRTNELLTIRRSGINYPESGAQGIVFPFRLPDGPAINSNGRLQHSLDVIQ